MKPTVKEIQSRLEIILKLQDISPRSQKARIIEWAMLHGIMLALGEDSPPYLMMLMASGRSILNEKS